MKKLICVFLIGLAFFVQPAFAEVITTDKPEGYEDYIYVAGSYDNYPIEYYDEDLKAYCGVIPDLLESISERTDMNFVYVNGDKTNKNVLGKNLKVDAVSAIDGNNNVTYKKDYIELVSYKKGEKTLRFGIVFTALMDDDKIAMIKNAANEISQDQINGIYLSYADNNNEMNYIWLVSFLLICMIFIAFIVFLFIRINRIQKEIEEEKLTDDETGMGNLQYFKYHFKHTINDSSRSRYYISYIILDSSYLRSYHGDSSFEEVLKYTASVLTEKSGDKEITARITENGFAFAFLAQSDDDAQKRLKSLMDKLNDFEDMKEKNNKLVFHCAAYHLLGMDKNCEILLFNLRKNCNRIFGTEKQIIYCDTHSMNKVAEEKKFTESIIKGFEKNEFKMYLQFIVDNKTKKIVSAEALSRWDRNEKGVVGPGKYIKNMENAGLISKHDFYMFELVCQQLEKWANTEYKDISISCNFTRITLSEKNFVEILKTISEKYNFDKSKLGIEITEDAIENDRETATENVRLCKELGFKIYLDDLGSGYTSLSNLCDYPIDVVKIDRDILLKTDTKRGKELFRGIISLAHSLNISVICEGVETEEQKRKVSDSDCDYIQGWYYSKAMPQNECEEFISFKSVKNK